jgi:proline iminopeptidase
MQFWAAALILTLAAGLVACGGQQTGEDETEPPAGLANGSFTTELNGFDIHYEIHGQGPVVMVVPNSWGFDIAGLRGVYGTLEDRLTMVYFDPRGMGGSGPLREESDMGLAAVRADFDALRQHLQLDRVNAIGWSNGAMNLLLLASEHPEILESAIFVHGAASFTAEDYAFLAEQHPEVMRGFEALTQELQNPDLTDEEKTTRMYQAWMESFFPASCADAEKMMPVLRQTFRVESFSWPHSDYANREAPEFDARDRLGAITARSLIIAGPHDTMPLSKAELMRDGIAGSTLVVFEDSGHFAPLEEPEKFRQVVFAFLGAEE